MTARPVLRSLAVAAALLCSSIAHAQLFRAYLAIDGNDANPCTLPAPCRLLPAALNAVADGGEIWMLDSANYNTATVNVTKSVKILAVPGAVGSVLATGGPAINIATAGVSVSLRNLVIVPLPGGGGTYGVYMSAGDSLTVEGSLLTGLPTGGLFVGSAASVNVVDTTIRTTGDAVLVRNGARATLTRCVLRSGNYAIYALGLAAGTKTTVSVTGSTIEGSFVGAMAYSGSATATVNLAVTDSQLDRNEYGLFANSAAGALVSLTASGNAITNASTAGITAFGAGAKVWAAGNTVTDNATGLVANGGGVFESAGNNAVRNNGSNKAGTIAVVAME
ncbi:MAG: right-handed parallel beta-helix repeat-containing protein [Burkholderiales bacterium]|nr:right-handed parallel beta-helix repeat-containing protein [Burkholderiales bacterium]